MFKAFNRIWFAPADRLLPEGGKPITIDELKMMHKQGYALAIGNENGVQMLSANQVVEAQGGNLAMAGASAYDGSFVTRDEAQTFSVSSRCIDLISTTVASFPWMYGRREGRHFVREEDPRYHNLFNTLPNLMLDANALWSQVMVSLLYDNVAFLHVMKDGNGPNARAMRLSYLEPWQVGVRKNGETDEFAYLVSNGSGVRERFSRHNIVHFFGPGNRGFDRGRSVVRKASNAIKIGLEADRHTYELFAGGSLQNFVLYSEDKTVKINENTATNIANAIVQRVANRTHGRTPLILPAGVKAREVSITPQNSQLQENRHYAKQDVGTHFGVPNYKFNEEASTTWGKNIAEASLAFERDTLAGWIRILESGINACLFPYSEMEMKMDTTNYSRDTFTERLEALRKAMGGNEQPGGISSNEFRVELGWPKGGKEFDKIYEPTEKAVRDAAPPSGTRGENRDAA